MIMSESDVAKQLSASQYGHFVDYPPYVQHISAFLILIELAPADDALVGFGILASAGQSLFGRPSTQHALNKTKQLLHVRF